MLGKWVAIGRFAEILLWSILGAFGIVVLWVVLAIGCSTACWFGVRHVRRRRRDRPR